MGNLTKQILDTFKYVPEYEKLDLMTIKMPVTGFVDENNTDYCNSLQFELNKYISKNKAGYIDVQKFVNTVKT